MQPLTSPPVFLDSFDPHVLDERRFLFFKLHGLEGQPYWYGDGAVTACSAEQLRTARLDGAMAFAANCWGGVGSPMVQALLAAGAAAVVTGEGLNWAGTRRVDGIDVMALAWRKFLELGFSAEVALRVGKSVARLRRPRLAADIASFALIGKKRARLRTIERTA
ncbi:MAG: hypothetical protein IT318_23730 [Anaerolineales bacterium]|nr:hypothetical protein [Anaerolineales bacterium]